MNSISSLQTDSCYMNPKCELFDLDQMIQIYNHVTLFFFFLEGKVIHDRLRFVDFLDTITRIQVLEEKVEQKPPFVACSEPNQSQFHHHYSYSPKEKKHLFCQ